MVYSGDMGNRLGPNGLSIGSSLQISSSKWRNVVHEGDEPDVLVHLFHPDLLPGKHLAHGDFAALTANAPAPRDDGGPINVYLTICDASKYPKHVASGAPISNDAVHQSSGDREPNWCV